MALPFRHDRETNHNVLVGSARTGGGFFLRLVALENKSVSKFAGVKTVVERAGGDATRSFEKVARAEMISRDADRWKIYATSSNLRPRVLGIGAKIQQGRPIKGSLKGMLACGAGQVIAFNEFIRSGVEPFACITSGPELD